MLEKEAQKQQYTETEDTKENYEDLEKAYAKTQNKNNSSEQQTQRFVYSTDDYDPEYPSSETYYTESATSYADSVTTTASASDNNADYSTTTTDTSHKNSQYPVSGDGSCPYCYSKYVKYIIVFAEGMKDEELPKTLRELLKRGQAFKMAKGILFI